jgi:hypothetical protein
VNILAREDFVGVAVSDKEQRETNSLFKRRTTSTWITDSPHEVLILLWIARCKDHNCGRLILRGDFEGELFQRTIRRILDRNQIAAKFVVIHAEE